MAFLIQKYKPSLFILLGDTYEVLSTALAAYISKIPIAHIHGGEITSGSLDDGFRHCISKLSSIHFVSHSSYKIRARNCFVANEKQKSPVRRAFLTFLLWLSLLFVFTCKPCSGNPRPLWNKPNNNFPDINHTGHETCIQAQFRFKLQKQIKRKRSNTTKVLTTI